MMMRKMMTTTMRMLWSHLREKEDLKRRLAKEETLSARINLIN